MIDIPREAFKVDVPELWLQRRKAGLCPVCGKTADEFGKRMKIFCSSECRDEYAKRYTFWSELRNEIIKRDGERCTVCGLDCESYMRERKQKNEEIIAQAFKQWIIKDENRDWLDIMRNKKLIELSGDYEDRYKKIMDDWELYNMCKYELDDKNRASFKHESHYYDRFWLEVDHIKAIINDGDMWDKENLRTICSLCHKKKTKKDLTELKIRKKRIKPLDINF